MIYLNIFCAAGVFHSFPGAGLSGGDAICLHLGAELRKIVGFSWFKASGNG
jgi:hypothetical protein